MTPDKHRTHWGVMELRETAGGSDKEDLQSQRFAVRKLIAYDQMGT